MAAPTISTISPTSGPATGGTSVVITGTDFTAFSTVRFDATATAFTLDSATQITAIAPPGPVGTASVTVTTPEGTSNGVTYTYLAVPVLTSASPNQGPTSGGTSVVLAGSGLTGVTAVSFGATPAAGFVVDSDTQITATSPVGTGIVNITVTGPGGTSNPVAFVYVFLPTISSIAPTSGPATGGNSVTITGTDFVGPLTVRFGATATFFTIDSDTSITATAPPGTGSVAVTVTGTGGTSNGVTYTYLVAPVLASITPATGPSAGGTVVTLAGTGFTGATTVSFGATGVVPTVISDISATATSPAAPPGTVSVTITNPIATSNALPYTYT
ncbi:IPT/TIG domain-containing protein [Nocardia sp. CNY236]|uniref:IPT/TIG domain-containing protein n=1 Tax=Nocardia sp. CNY236 TaxID=1169152 RepID=UPI0004233006|nr:IPT/TIG domain-containing protein [Nocardia sp. CNY236]